MLLFLGIFLHPFHSRLPLHVISDQSYLCSLKTSAVVASLLVSTINVDSQGRSRDEERFPRWSGNIRGRLIIPGKNFTPGPVPESSVKSSMKKIGLRVRCVPESPPYVVSLQINYTNIYTCPAVASNVASCGFRLGSRRISNGFEVTNFIENRGMTIRYVAGGLEVVGFEVSSAHGNNNPLSVRFPPRNQGFLFKKEKKSNGTCTVVTSYRRLIF